MRILCGHPHHSRALGGQPHPHLPQAPLCAAPLLPLSGTVAGAQIRPPSLVPSAVASLGLGPGPCPPFGSSSWPLTRLLGTMLAIILAIFNILAILGITSLVEPLSLGEISWADLAVMTLVPVILLPMLFTKSMLSRVEGILLLMCYVGYLGFISVRL